MKYLLDTNILLLHLSDNALLSAPSDADFFISTITVAESLRYPGLGDDDLTALRDLMNVMTVVSVDQAIALRAGDLGRTRKTRLPDLLIAATALEWSLILVTKDVRDFRNIPRLDVQSSF